MTLGSASSGGHARDALSGRRKVAIVTGASSGINWLVKKTIHSANYKRLLALLKQIRIDAGLRQADLARLLQKGPNLRLQVRNR